MIPIYAEASGAKSGSTLRKSNIPGRKSRHTPPNTTVRPTLSATVPPMAFLTLFSSFAPKQVATMIPKPQITPFRNSISRSLREVVAPTAASDTSPSVLPMILVSIRL